MTFEDILALLGACAMVVAVLFFTYYASRWYARRLSGTGGSAGSGRHIRFIDRASLSAGAALVIIRVGAETDGRYYLIGISEKNMQLICELPDFTPGQNSESQPGSFAKLFSGLLAKRQTPQTDEKGDDAQ